MRIRSLVAITIAAVAGVASHAAGAMDFLNQITGGNGSGMYPSSVAAGNACMDEFEINGLAGVGPAGSAQITGIQAVFMTDTPPAAFRVGIYTNTNDPNFNNLRTSAVGDVFSQTIDRLDQHVTIQPFTASGVAGNFPNAFLLTITFDNLFVPFGEYYLSVQAEGAAPFFIMGSDNVVVGTPNNLIQVMNQGPGGVANVIADNAAYRIMGIPTPGTLGLLTLAGLAALRRRR